MAGNMIFAKRIKELRQQDERGFSQEDIAAKFKYSKQTVSQWENKGKVPRHAVLLELAELFETTTDYLLGYSNERYTQPSSHNDLVKMANEIHQLGAMPRYHEVVKIFNNMSAHEREKRMQEAWDMVSKIESLPANHREAVRIVIDLLAPTQK